MSELMLNPWIRALFWGLVMITGVMTVTAWSTWFERKFAGRMQSRMGPTLVGPLGLLQPIADACKLLQKEDLVPDSADRALFNLAPVLTVGFAMGVAAVVPFTPTMLAADLDVGVLWLLALSGLMVFPTWMGSWASNNKYSLIAAMRAVAQGISYEVPMVLAIMVPVIMTGTLSLSDMVADQQKNGWLIYRLPLTGLIAFVIFFLASLAEANRIPFDIPEAESELVAGPTTEYTGMKFGLFYMAEYIHTLLSSAICAAVFFGGWDGPIAPGLHWMLLKSVILFVFLTWVRWSFLRLRSDQLMNLCWKYAVPATLALIPVTAFYTVYAAGKGGV
ncbi:NADH-quinone oxidoreductase subunit NuoH [Myxococcota bacterium]|nr:NADH-quinone oxidoreductase subunit NuoH [Myxococcota bacterium]